MTAAERRALLGDAVVDRINAEADAAIAEYPPTQELLDLLRPVLTSPCGASAELEAVAEQQTAA
ncbi:hypothetical protein ACFXKX_24075 [Streptomyces scopuliridis]|uniref:hypothetical protein n=1 Tax=Streptomyces scopuliridis TaxID=452529 RepID=UPI0036C427CF